MCNLRVCAILAGLFLSINWQIVQVCSQSDFPVDDHSDDSVLISMSRIANRTCGGIRPCVRLSCPRGHYFINYTHCKRDSKFDDLLITVLLTNGEQRDVQLFEHFEVALGSFCDGKMSFLHKAERWSLTDVRS